MLPASCGLMRAHRDQEETLPSGKASRQLCVGFAPDCVLAVLSRARSAFCLCSQPGSLACQEAAAHGQPRQAAMQGDCGRRHQQRGGQDHPLRRNHGPAQARQASVCGHLQSPSRSGMLTMACELQAQGFDGAGLQGGPRCAPCCQTDPLDQPEISWAKACRPDTTL